MFFSKNYCQFKKNHYLCNRKNAIKRVKAALARCLPSESILFKNAQVAELVDALVSGTSVRKDVQVRALSRAPKDGESRLFRFNMEVLIEFWQAF